MAYQGDAVVLHVDDDVGLLDLTAAVLEREDERLTLHTESSAEAGLAWLRDHSADCVVSDYDMPRVNGLEFLEAVREEFPSLPFVLFTGKGSEEIASEAISAGVTDYLQKGRSNEQFTVLANRVRNLVEGRRAEADLARRAAQYEAVARLGTHALGATEWTAVADQSMACLADSLGAEYASLLRWRPEAGEFSLVAGVGWPDERVGTATVAAGPDSQAGFTLAEATPVVVSDRDTETRFASSTLLADAGVTSGISVVVGAEGDPWGVLAVHTGQGRRFTDDDVTFLQSVANVLAAAIERTAAEERLRESERRFRRMAELSPDPIFTLGVDGVLVYVAPAASRVYGLDPEAMVGTHFGNFVGPGSEAAAAEAFQSVLDGDRVTGLRLDVVGGDGEPVPSVLDAVLVEDGEAVAVQGFVRATRSRRSAV